MRDIDYQKLRDDPTSYDNGMFLIYDRKDLLNLIRIMYRLFSEKHMNGDDMRDMAETIRLIISEIEYEEI